MSHAIQVVTATATQEDAQKIASALVTQSLNLFQSVGVRAVYLEVRLANQPAQAFYRKLGFQEHGRRPRYYHRPSEDAVVMRLLMGPKKDPK